MSPPELEIVIKIQGDLKAPDSVNEHADKGGRIAILEPSGSGKSIINEYYRLYIFAVFPSEPMI